MLVEEFLKPMELSQAALAEKLGVHAPVVSDIVTGKRAITTEMAFKLSDALGTTPHLWLNAQIDLDVWREQQRRKKAS